MVRRTAVLVSTHSRPKAAVYEAAGGHRQDGFNTQPPEGGWAHCFFNGFGKLCFNTQPPEGGWTGNPIIVIDKPSFNTQPPEGGCSGLSVTLDRDVVSTHSRPKAAEISPHMAAE